MTYKKRMMGFGWAVIKRKVENLLNILTENLIEISIIVIFTYIIITITT